MKALFAAVALSLAPAAYAYPVVVATPYGPTVVAAPIRPTFAFRHGRFFRPRFLRYGRLYRRFR